MENTTRYQQKQLAKITLSVDEMLQYILVKVNKILDKKIETIHHLGNGNIWDALAFGGWDVMGSYSVTNFKIPSDHFLEKGKIKIHCKQKRDELSLEVQELEMIKKIYYAFTKVSYRIEFKIRIKMYSTVINGKLKRLPFEYIGYRKKHPLAA